MSPARLPLSQTIKLLIVVLVLSIAAVPNLPNYITHNWSWNHPPQVAALKQLQAMQRSGLTLPDWQTSNQQVIEIGRKKWSAQTLTSPAQPDAQAVQLLLRPQTWHRDQPEVEWMDIHGMQHWSENDRQTVEFIVGAPIAASPVSVKARFFRGWGEQQTYAVLQWYAWSNGGSPAPNQWFWADQMAQWRSVTKHPRQRTPWVAACLMIPIQPLSDVEAARPLAESLGKAVQSALMNAIDSPA